MVQHNIEIALDLVKRSPRLVVAKDRGGYSPFYALACMPDYLEIGSYFGNDGSIPVSTIPFTLHSCFSLTCFSIMQIMDEFNYINVNYVMIFLKKKSMKKGALVGQTHILCL